MHPLWASNKRVAKALVRHAKSVARQQNGLHLGEGAWSGNKDGSLSENRRSQTDATMYIVRKATPKILYLRDIRRGNHCTNDGHAIHQERGRPKHRGSSSNYFFIACFVNNVDYGDLWFARYHCASTCPILNQKTNNALWNWKNINSAILLASYSFSWESRRQRCSGKSTPNSLGPRKRSLDRNWGTIPNTHYSRAGSI